jgi:hypothetical protein
MENLRTEKERLRGRPTKAYLATLRSMRRKDYVKLEKACLDAYLLGANNVIVAFPYVTKFPEDFPHKRFVRSEGRIYYYRISAPVLLKWLHEKGYTDLTGAKIGWAIQSFNQQMKELLSELQ